MPSLDAHPYAAFLDRVLKPTRYTGAEHGVRPKDWSGVEARVCLAFPDVYDIGMSHLGFRILYRILNDDPRTLAERCYTPWVDLQDEIRARGLPLVSLESARPLRDFDVVGFSLQFELTYTNVLAMLDLGGIPLRAAARGEADPLVIAGGPVATHAEPLAPFIDAFVIGDGEEAATEIALAWAEGKAAGRSRGERLARLARLPGVYVPALYATTLDPDTGLEVVTGPLAEGVPFPITRRVVDLAKHPFPDDGPVGGPEAIFDRMSMEIARGCTEGCRFCQAGMIYRPVRERDPKEVVDTVLSAIAKSGQDEVSLTALSTADVSAISPLIKTLAEKTAPRRVSLSVASLRAYGLSEDLLDDMAQVRAAGLTFAPEAGTQRMRDVINKNVTEEQLLETAERVFSRGHDKMKLYFIIGLPTETAEDVRAIIDVGHNALKVGHRHGGRAKVTVSVSNHVPKPHTPFQWCAMDTLESLHEKQTLLREAVRQGPRALQLRLHDAATSVLEGVFARGDRRLADVLEAAYRNGARFDSWDSELDLVCWQRAFAATGVEPSAYLGTYPVSGRLPWDHLDIGLEPGFLLGEYRRALKSRLSPPCSKAVGQFVHHASVEEAERDTRKLVCYQCGVACDLTAMRAERLDFLRKMGALAPGARVHLPLAPNEPGKPRRPGRYRPPQPGGAPQRWRLQYIKRGGASLLGHLDLIRELGRVLRRAGLQVRYTEGFHPKADMSFGPALALGAASFGEYVDVRLVDPPAAESLLGALAQAAPPGLEFTGAVPLGAGDGTLARIVDAADYVLGVDAAAVTALGGTAALAARIATLMAAETHWIARRHKGRDRPVDVRGALLALEVGDAADAALLARAELPGVLVPVRARIVVSNEGTARPSEVVAALMGTADCPHRVLRVGLLAGGQSPLAQVSQVPAGVEQHGSAAAAG